MVRSMVFVAPHESVHIRHPQWDELERKLVGVIQSRHYSPKTELAYSSWVRRFIRYHGDRHPDLMAEREMNQYLSFLAVRKR